MKVGNQNNSKSQRKCIPTLDSSVAYSLPFSKISALQPNFFIHCKAEKMGEGYEQGGSGREV